MHHAQAPQALSVGDADEFGQCHTGLVAAQAMKVDLALNGPAAFAQLLRHVDADAGTPKTQGVIRVEQSAHIKTIAQGVAQHRFFVFFALQGHRRWGGWADAGLVVRGQPLDNADRTHKQIGLGFALAFSGKSSGLFGLGFLMGLGELFLDLLEVLQGIDFHPLIVPQKVLIWRAVSPFTPSAAGAASHREHQAALDFL